MSFSASSEDEIITKVILPQHYLVLHLQQFVLLPECKQICLKKW